MEKYKSNLFVEDVLYFLCISGFFVVVNYPEFDHRFSMLFLLSKKLMSEA